MFDIVKEVVSDVIGGIATQSLGLGTGRSSGEQFSLIGSVMRAVNKVATGGSC